MTKKIFISYRRKDGLAVEALMGAINAMGDYDIWFDGYIRGGQHWWDEIVKQLQNADIVILALSPAYLESVPCEEERRYAQALGKVIIPVLIDPELDMGAIKDTIISLRQIVEYHTHERNRQALQEALEAAEPQSLPDSMPDPPPEPIPDDEQDKATLNNVSHAPKRQFRLSDMWLQILLALIAAAATIIAAIITISPDLFGARSTPTNTPATGVQSPAPNNTPLPTIQAVSGDFDITLIYGGSDSFTIRANAESHLYGLTLSTTLSDEIPVDSFPALATVGYVIQEGTCLEYVRSGETPPRPRGCSADSSFSIELLDADLFWYDTGSNQAQDIALHQDGQVLALCSSASRQCDLSTSP